MMEPFAWLWGAKGETWWTGSMLGCWGWRGHDPIRVEHSVRDREGRKDWLNCEGALIGVLEDDSGDRGPVVPMGDHFASKIGGRGIDGFCGNGLGLPGFERDG